MVKCRDFVNLRCWQLCRDGRVIEGVDLHPTNSQALLLTPVTEEFDDDDDVIGDGQDDADSDDECILNKPSPKVTKSWSEFKLESSSVSDSTEQKTKTAFSTLSKSLGAQDFQHGGGGGANSDPEDVFSDALTEHLDRVNESREVAVKIRRRPRVDDEVQKGGNVYVSAAISIVYPSAPVSNKYIRSVAMYPSNAWWFSMQ